MYNRQVESGRTAASEEASAPASFFPAHRHRQVLADCLDVPGQLPTVAIPLDAVGISAKTVWIRLPQGRLPFDLRLEVDLAAHRRGIHMSRLEEAISALHEVEFAQAGQYALELARLAVPGQESRRGRVELRGRLPRISRTGVSGRHSLDAYDLRVEVDLDGAEVTWRWRMGVGVGVHHITACPCTQAYNQLLLSTAGENPVADSSPILQPTHSQRSHTTLMVVATHETEAEKVPEAATPSQEQLLQCLAAALHLSQDLLKRPDEAELVYASHRHPQFAEDTVRETAQAAGRLLGPVLPPASRLLINTVGLESIHSHDVHCRLETTLAALSG
ncbi:GTP cyclohydrolase I FolE2 [Desulfurivibrio dismutans]|uniref:GTP cyclohydrolase I FolE2 n=1 Tax=Desulfurivibrio dismutans TaxID=1398908 RepID=UPI0023DB73CB|nr:GTP cyclohydrolase I FolE2 [Desulfurivibrio alkaliphilus]MDF1613599.1 GTP cyclohydrolase I FolE2 [Desulfurivibrio alkaliphilus]